MIKELPTDIDPVWAGDGSQLPEWFVSALKVPREEGYAEIDGARAHYFRWGDRDKPKVLMTHGLLAHSRCFAFIAPFLAEDYDVVAFDLAGMGDSEMRGQADIAARGREFREIAEALDMFSNGDCRNGCYLNCAKRVQIANMCLHQVAPLVRARLSGRRLAGIAAARSHRKSPEKAICLQPTGEVCANSSSDTSSPIVRRCATASAM